MKNPERAFLSGLSERLRQEKLFAKTEEILRENPPLNPDDFRDLYGDENVNTDTAYVEKMEQKFREGVSLGNAEGRKLARALEVIIAEQIELSDWMGPDAVTILPSRFDDIFNGVDLIAEFQNEEERKASHMAFAIDVTSGDDLSKKIKRIKDEILHGELARVKYFESEFLGIRGELRNIPRIIIGVDTRSSGFLGETWLAHDTEALAKHEVQKVILEEIRAELAAFAAYARQAERFAGPDKQGKIKKIVEVYERALQSVENILVSKKEIPLGAFAEDDVFRSIMREMERLEKGY